MALIHSLLTLQKITFVIQSSSEQKTFEDWREKSSESLTEFRSPGVLTMR